MKITVIGELCEDIFVYGETKRLSPEAPVPVFNPFYTDKNPGMAGNVVENLKPLDLDIEVGFIHQNKIITKTRFVDYKSNHMFIRVDEGENNVEPLILTEEIIEQIKESDAVIISDYNKGFLDENVLKRKPNINVMKSTFAVKFLSLCILVSVASCNKEEIKEDQTKELSSGIRKENMDTIVKPGDNFMDYVNGTWLKNTEIPSDKSSYGIVYMLYEESQ